MTVAAAVARRAVDTAGTGGRAVSRAAPGKSGTVSSLIRVLTASPRSASPRFDPALRVHQRVGAEPLDRRCGRQDGSPGATAVGSAVTLTVGAWFGFLTVAVVVAPSSSVMARSSPRRQRLSQALAVSETVTPGTTVFLSTVTPVGRSARAEVAGLVLDLREALTAAYAASGRTAPRPDARPAIGALVTPGDGCRSSPPPNRPARFPRLPRCPVSDSQGQHCLSELDPAPFAHSPIDRGGES